jgi:acyl-CoA synthetase (AMP-forming)/AMP-acid ligase II
MMGLSSGARRDREAESMTARIMGDLISGAPADSPFLISPEQGVTLTYRDFQDQVDAAAAGFQRRGLRPGEAVGIVIPNGVEVLVAFFGALQAGAAAQPINPDLTPDEIDFALEDSHSVLVITTPASAARIANCRSLPDRRVLLSFEPATGTTVDGQTGGTPAPVDVRPEMDALYLYTSGTTSRPKCVPLTHANLVASARNVAASYALRADETTLCVMPLFHVHGLVASVFATMVAGGAVVVPPRFSASNFWPLVRAHNVAWYTGVPTMHTILLNTAEENLGGPVPPLRFVRSCSSALPDAVEKAFEDRFGVPVLQAYGMTEAAHQMATNPLPPAARKPNSVGLPTGIEVAILDDDGNLLPAGQTGEVSIKGPNVTRGYLRNPEANATAFTNGWFRTGDSGALDGDGYLFLHGRIKELINRGGEKISPIEVDDVLMRYPGIKEACTVGVPHPIYGEEVEAVIAMLPGQAENADAILAHCRASLAPFKVPKLLRFVPEIPRSATGKIQRRRLLEMLG